MPDVLKAAEDGSVTLPAEMLRTKGVRPGDILVVKPDGAGFYVKAYSQVIRELQDEVLRRIPADVNLADELIAERRREAERE